MLIVSDVSVCDMLRTDFIHCIHCMLQSLFIALHVCMPCVCRLDVVRSHCRNSSTSDSKMPHIALLFFLQISSILIHPTLLWFLFAFFLAPSRGFCRMCDNGMLGRILLKECACVFQWGVYRYLAMAAAMLHKTPSFGNIPGCTGTSWKPRARWPWYNSSPSSNMAYEFKRNA